MCVCVYRVVCADCVVLQRAGGLAYGPAVFTQLNHEHQELVKPCRNICRTQDASWREGLNWEDKEDIILERGVNLAGLGFNLREKQRNKIGRASCRERV